MLVVVTHPALMHMPYLIKGRSTWVLVHKNFSPFTYMYTYVFYVCVYACIYVCVYVCTSSVHTV